MVQTLTRDRIRDVIETTGNCMVPSTSSRMAGKLVDEVVQCVCQSCTYTMCMFQPMYAAAGSHRHRGAEELSYKMQCYTIL